MTLDFGDEATGVQVTSYLEAVLRTVGLTSSFTDDKVTCSS